MRIADDFKAIKARMDELNGVTPPAPARPQPSGIIDWAWAGAVRVPEIEWVDEVFIRAKPKDSK